MPQRHIDGLNGIGGVDHGCRMSSGKAKSGITRGKSRTPRLADTRIECIPLLGKQLQIELGFRLSAGRVNRFEIGRNRFHVFV